ncbi:hypothetical protein ACH4TP_37985 [Streptomyces sp. NPDC021012]|uniref:hypothetical protein n=1 Tax=Streptomyces sp. NPDC021012 TaxID=3365107 RepID=UPI0037889EFA
MPENQCCADETCFDCRYWQEKTEWADNGDRVPAHISGDDLNLVARIDGKHYMVGPMNHTRPAHWLGYGGTVFTFRFHDGREITSNDVWAQGDIPQRWRDRLPDNAVIVPTEPRPTTVPFGPTEGLALENT